MRAIATARALSAVFVCLFFVSRANAQDPNGQLQPVPPGQSTRAQRPTDGLGAGGLAPPPPMQSEPNAPYQTPGHTEQELRESEKKDTGRGLEWFYFSAEGGYEILGLETFKANNLTNGIVASKSSGFVYGAGAGIRLVFITLGARVRMGNFQDYKVGTVNAEFGLHIPLGSVEPYFTLGAGYAFLGALDAKSWGASDVSIRGYNVRGGAGLDYYVTPVLSIGANVTGEILGLSRPGVTPSGAGPTTPAQADGSSVGAALTLSGVAGLHF